MITPSTDIILLKCPLELSDINQLTFANATAQFNYFNSLPKRRYDDATYQRKDGVIRFNAEMDDIIQFNYVMYRNENYGNKWFYAYITDMQYINDNMTAVAIKTDVFQTWQFQFDYKTCFVEREHVSNDTVGANTVPEGLETGPFIHNGNPIEYNYGGFSNTITIIAVSDDSVISTNFPGGISVSKNLYNGVYSGLTYYAIKHTGIYDNKFKDFLDAYDQADKGNAVYSMFEVPSSNQLNLNLVETTKTGIYYVLGNGLPYDLSDISLTRPSSLAGYSPKNAKLLTAPYNYFYVSNNAGEDIDYRYEDFGNPNSINFTVKYVVCAGSSIKAYPRNYLNTTAGKGNFNAGINGSKFPICAWTTDVYTNWLTQNALNISNTQIEGYMSAATNTIGGIATMNPSQIAESGFGLMQTMNRLAEQYYEHSLIPPQAKGDVASGDLTYCDYKSGFTVHKMSIKPEYARIIDDFFSAFGYRVARLKVPNITGRPNWNYVKTVGAYVGGDIPQEDVTEFKGLLDRGITFWHNPNTFMDYNQNNN